MGYVFAGPSTGHCPQPDTCKKAKTTMIIEPGDLVLVAHRRLFEGDAARFFVGRTMACEGSLFKAEGYSFMRDLSNGHIIKKEEKRIKILSFSSPGQLVYQLPGDVELESVEIVSRNADDVLMAGARCVMDLSERTHCKHF
jgi:hypothetical protein